jgi:Protein of unknown function (DUF3822)
VPSLPWHVRSRKRVRQILYFRHVSAFDPELTARALMPRDLVAQSATLLLALHIGPRTVVAGVSGGASEWAWQQSFVLASENSDWHAAVAFLRDRNWHDGVFRSVTISFDTDATTLVPKAFEAPDKLNELLAFHLQRPVDDVLRNDISVYDAVMICEWPAALAPLKQWWPNAIWFPVGVPLLHLMHRLSHTSHALAAVVMSHHVYIAASGPNQLQVLNRYTADSDTDVLYHISNVCMRLGWSMTDTPVWLSGATPTCAELLRTYCGAIQSLDRPNDPFPLSAHRLCV